MLKLSQRFLCSSQTFLLPNTHGQTFQWIIGKTRTFPFARNCCCRAVLPRVGTAPGSQGEGQDIQWYIGEEEELNTQISPRAQLPPGALALPWHSVWRSSSASSKAKKSGLSWAPGLCEPSWHRRCLNSASFPRTLAKGE